MLFTSHCRMFPFCIDQRRIWNNMTTKLLHKPDQDELHSRDINQLKSVCINTLSSSAKTNKLTMTAWQKMLYVLNPWCRGEFKWCANSYWWFVEQSAFTNSVCSQVLSVSLWTHRKVLIKTFPFFTKRCEIQ